MRDPGADQIGWQHEQRLTDAVPAEDLSAAAMQAELRILVGKNLRLRCPEPVRGLQSMHRIGASQFARLHHKRKQPSREA